MAGSTWGPLHVRLFRALWIATLVSNVGTWMQTVGAQWLLVHRPHAAILVSLVQTAALLPAVLFSFIGGVLADTFDRRRLLVAVQLGMVLTGVGLTALTLNHHMPPALLLTFTFLLGIGSALTAPAYQSLVPEMVSHADVPAASALSSININLSRAIGPAIAGLLIARLGVGTVFGINTATFLLFAVTVVVCWRELGGAPDNPEGFLAAFRAGGRYVSHAPVVRRILLRAVLFLVPGSAVWALLPLVASDRLKLGSSGYGLLLGALGLGAVGGALVLPWARKTLSRNALVGTTTIVYSAAILAVGTVRNTPFVLVVLLPTGAVWMAFLSTVNAALQLFLPRWVRARGLSLYQAILFGSQAVAAALWGFVASAFGVEATFCTAAVAMIASAASVAVWPLLNASDMNRDIVSVWPEPLLAIEPSPEGGPIAVMITYTIAADDEQAFLRAMQRVRDSRRRTGAVRWQLYRDAAHRNSFVEYFVVSTWEEHMRQHSVRLTGTDQQFEETAKALSDPPPVATHFLPATR
jgi:MFS family permease